METTNTALPELLPLQFPTYNFRIQQHRDSRQILDEVRRQFVPLTPEEWVRQHLVRYLIEERGVPTGLVEVEKSFRFGNYQRRADVVVKNRRYEHVLVAECKAPSVRLGQNSFNQIGRYNLVLRACYMLVTNGMEHYCCRVDFDRQSSTFLSGIPSFSTLDCD